MKLHHPLTQYQVLRTPSSFYLLRFLPLLHSSTSGILLNMPASKGSPSKDKGISSSEDSSKDSSSISVSKQSSNSTSVPKQSSTVETSEDRRNTPTDLTDFPLELLDKITRNVRCLDANSYKVFKQARHHRSHGSKDAYDFLDLGAYQNKTDGKLDDHKLFVRRTYEGSTIGSCIKELNYRPGLKDFRSLDRSFIDRQSDNLQAILEACTSVQRIDLQQELPRVSYDAKNTAAYPVKCWEKALQNKPRLESFKLFGNNSTGHPFEAGLIPALVKCSLIKEISVNSFPVSPKTESTYYGKKQGSAYSPSPLKYLRKLELIPISLSTLKFISKWTDAETPIHTADIMLQVDEEVGVTQVIQECLHKWSSHIEGLRLRCNRRSKGESHTIKLNEMPKLHYLILSNFEIDVSNTGAKMDKLGTLNIKGSQDLDISDSCIKLMKGLLKSAVLMPNLRLLSVATDFSKIPVSILNELKKKRPNLSISPYYVM